MNLSVSNDITLNVRWVYSKQRFLSDEWIYVNQKAGLPVEPITDLCAWHYIPQNVY